MCDIMCGNCSYRKKIAGDQDWSCDCSASYRYGEYTGYNEHCEDFKQRQSVDDLKSRYKLYRKHHGK